jgi:hypothetical protein
MSLELIREAIKINSMIGEDSTQTVFENDIIVPDVKPDIARILLIDSNVYVNSAEPVNEKIAVSGVVLYKILYISEDAEKSVKSINANANFYHTLDIANIKPGMKCKAKCEVEHMEYNVLNGRKVNVKAVVKVSGKVYDETDKEIACDITGMEDIQSLRESISINSYLGDNRINYIIKENMELPSSKPSINEILRNDVKITGKDYKIADNKVIVKGELTISTLFTGDDEARSIQFMEHEIPFTQFIDLPGLDEYASCDVDYQIIDSRFEAGEDSDGEPRVLRGEISLNIFVAGYARKSVEVLTDAYSPRTRLGLEKQALRLEDITVENRSQVNIKDTLVLEDDSPEIAEVFNVLSKPVLTECKLYDDKVVIEGLVNSDVLYLANDSEQPVFCQRQETPFKHTIDCKGTRPEMGYEVDLDVEHCSYSMLSANEVEFRLALGVAFKGVDPVEIPLIAKVTETPPDEKRVATQPSMIIYFLQPGDTLWKVAKKYYTTVADIERVNNLSDHDALLAGQQIIIPRRI